MIACAVDWLGQSRPADVVTRMLGGAQDSAASYTSARVAVAASRDTNGNVASVAAHDDHRLTVAVDGRLDNGSEIRRELGVEADESTAFLVALAYDRWRDDFVLHLRGDYAVAIWDDREKRVVAARDPFGIRPLYFASATDQLWLVSDVEQLVIPGIVGATPDDQMVVEFLTREYRSLERTYFRSIRRVPPGHILVATNWGIRTTEYRAPPATEIEFSTTAECHEEFRRIFFESVKRRLKSTNPVVIQVSGGIDSTSIMSAANTLAASGSMPKIVGAAALHPGLPCDEEEHIDAVAAHVRIPITTWDGTRAMATELSEPLIAGPGSRVRMTGGADGFVEIARAEDAHVVIDGTGGDQLGQPLGVPLDELRAGQWYRGVRHLLPEGTSLVGGVRRLLWAAHALAPASVQRFRGALRRRREPPPWLASSVTGLAFPRPETPPTRTFASCGQRLRWELLTRANLALSVEVKQRHAVRSGLEVRFPFLDWDLVSFVLAVPFRHWPEPTWLARLHREALRGDLPPSSYERRSKAEFTPALVNRVRRQLGTIRDLFEGTTWASGRFVDQHAARRQLVALERSQSPDFLLTYTVWAIASVEAWLRAVLRYPSRPHGIRD